MSKAEEENRINSLALTFLERQQIQPNIFADQIIRGYKEGYHQAEKNNELTWEDIREICRMWIESKTPFGLTGEALSIEVLKRFKTLKGESV